MYRIMIDGHHTDIRSEPFRQTELRNYMIDKNLRLSGIDFSGLETVYRFESVRRTGVPINPVNHIRGDGTDCGC